MASQQGALGYYTSQGGASDAPSGWLFHISGWRGRNGFGSTTTAEKVAANWSGEVNGQPKVVIITGAGSGLGLESAIVLAGRGAEVIVTGRNQSKGEVAVNAVLKHVPDAKVSFMLLDVASLKSVREFAAAFKATGKPLNVLMLNAGVMFPPFGLSVDGHELQFATNHLGHWLLTQLLLDVMLDTAEKCGIKGRIVSVASVGHQLYKYPEDIRFDKLDSPEGYDTQKAYGQSKLCNILLARKLNEQLQGKPIIATSCHPGLIAATELMRHMHGGMQWLGRSGLLNPFLKSIQKGAATQVYLTVSDDVVPGEYYVDCNLGASSRAAHSKYLAQKLWEVSEEMCKE